MAKIAIVCLGFHGHVNPTLGIAEALKARGHDVVYLAARSFLGKVTTVGARLHPFADDLSASMQKMSDQDFNSEKRRALYERDMRTACDELATVIAQELPDLLLYGFLFPEALGIAERLEIPAVRYFTTYAMNGALDVAKIFRPDDSMTSDPGTRAFIERTMGPAPDSLVFLPLVFQPEAEIFDNTYHFVGPCVRTNETTCDEVAASTNGKSLIVISLGTIFHDRPEFYKMCVDVFRDRPERVIMAVGSAEALAALPPLPENITARVHIPQVRLLSEASLFIFHGGMNSTMEALSHGVPLVVIPQMPEQALTARRVEELGAGLALDRDRLSATLLTETVAKIMSEESFRKKAVALQGQIQRSGGTAQAVALIEKRLFEHQRSSLSVSSWRTLSGIDAPSDATPGST